VEVHTQVDLDRQPEDINDASTSNTGAEGMGKPRSSGFVHAYQETAFLLITCPRPSAPQSNPDESARKQADQPGAARQREADAPEASRSRGTGRPGTARPREAIRIPRREVFLVEERGKLLKMFKLLKIFIHNAYLVILSSN
jgi:hypothetical protein